MLVSQAWLLLKRPKDHLVESNVDVNSLGRRRKATDRELAGQHLVEDDAQRVNVGAVVHVGRVLDLLGRHVMRRPHHLSRLRQTRPVCRTGEKREAEVGDLRRTRSIEQDVLRFDISMHDALIVGVLQRRTDARHHRQRLTRCKPPAAIVWRSVTPSTNSITR